MYLHLHTCFWKTGIWEFANRWYNVLFLVGVYAACLGCMLLCLCATHASQYPSPHLASLQCRLLMTGDIFNWRAHSHFHNDACISRCLCAQVCICASSRHPGWKLRPAASVPSGSSLEIRCGSWTVSLPSILCLGGCWHLPTAQVQQGPMSWTGSTSSETGSGSLWGYPDELFSTRALALCW
jgi:hypothetical protein